MRLPTALAIAASALVCAACSEPPPAPESVAPSAGDQAAVDAYYASRPEFFGFKTLA